MPSARGAVAKPWTMALVETQGNQKTTPSKDKARSKAMTDHDLEIVLEQAEGDWEDDPIFALFDQEDQT